MINELFKESKVSFLGLNCIDNKVLSEKKYFVVNNDFLLYFAKKYLNLNVLLDNNNHSNEIGLKDPCVCLKKINNINYLSIYYKEICNHRFPYESYHLNCFERFNKEIYFKQYLYTTNKNFIKKILKEYKIKNNCFQGLEICKGSSYRNKNKSDKIAIIDEKNDYRKIKFLKPSIEINIPNTKFIAYGQDKNTKVKSYYFTDNHTWKIPNKVLYNLNEAV